jgi:hypothetical protein
MGLLNAMLLWRTGGRECVCLSPVDRPAFAVRARARARPALGGAAARAAAGGGGARRLCVSFIDVLCRPMRMVRAPPLSESDGGRAAATGPRRRHAALSSLPSPPARTSAHTHTHTRTKYIRSFSHPTFHCHYWNTQAPSDRERERERERARTHVGRRFRGDLALFHQLRSAPSRRPALPPCRNPSLPAPRALRTVLFLALFSPTHVLTSP